MHWRKRLRIAIQQAAIVLGGGLLVWLFLQTPLNPKINQILYDILLNQVPMAAEESRVIILGIDDRALKEFKEPMVLWHRYLSTAIDAASQAGARAVGFDFIPAISLQSIAPELERMFYKALRQSVSRGTRILLG